MHGSTHGSEPAARKASRHDRHIERQRFLDGVHAIVVRGAGAAAIIRDIDFREAIAKSGITPPSVIEADGRLHRFATNGKVADKAGWYIYFSDGIPAGAYGCWRSGTSETWRADIGRALTTAEEAAHRAKVEAMRREREAEEIRRHTEAREKAVAIWKATTPAADDHPYLARKGVKAHGLRMHQGALVVPMRDGGELHSLQFIAEDGDKRFLTGGRVAGCYFSIGTTQGAAALCIAEGFATGATIFEATGYPVAVAFNAGNLGLVAKAIRERFPDLSLILCADDDAATTGNPGMTKATVAAQAVGGLLAAPNFGENRPEGATDFNDMAAHRGLEAVRLAIASASAPRGYGYTGIQSTDIPSTSIQALIGRLAKLQPMEYDRAREREAKQLGARVATLDTEVRKARGETAEDAAQGHAMVFPETEPWPEAVDGGELLDEVAGRLAGYLV